MASKNRTFSMTKGAYGTQMGFNLYDALGKFTITGTVKIFAKLQGGSRQCDQWRKLQRGWPVYDRGHGIRWQICFHKS
jgi:hypothetical protein